MEGSVLLADDWEDAVPVAGLFGPRRWMRLIRSTRRRQQQQQSALGARRGGQTERERAAMRAPSAGRGDEGTRGRGVVEEGRLVETGPAMWEIQRSDGKSTAWRGIGAEKTRDGDGWHVWNGFETRAAQKLDILGTWQQHEKKKKKTKQIW